MKRIFNNVLIVLFITGLSSSSKLVGQSYEFNLGFNKLNIVDNDTPFYSLNKRPKYETEYIIDIGFEISPRVTTHWVFSKKHEAIAGIEFNIWSRNSIVTNGDVRFDWRDGSFSNRTLSTQLDLLLGYRYSIVENNGKTLFVENVLHGNFISISKFPGLKYSTEPGIGLKIKFNDSINLLSVVSFKQALGNSKISRTVKKSFAVRLGVSKTL